MFSGFRVFTLSGLGPKHAVSSCAEVEPSSARKPAGMCCLMHARRKPSPSCQGLKNWV